MSVIINRPDLGDQLVRLLRPTGRIPVADSIGTELVPVYPYLEGSRPLETKSIAQVVTSAPGFNNVSDILPQFDDDGRPIWHYIIAAHANHNDPVNRGTRISLESPGAVATHLAVNNNLAAGEILTLDRPCPAIGQAVGGPTSPMRLRVATTAMGAGFTVSLTYLALPYLFAEPHLAL